MLRDRPVLLKKKKETYGIKSLSYHFENEIYEYVNSTWLLLTPALNSFFNSEYREIFNSTYVAGHLGTAASKNVLLKLRKIITSFNFALKTDLFNANVRHKFMISIS